MVQFLFQIQAGGAERQADGVLWIGANPHHDYGDGKLSTIAAQVVLPGLVVRLYPVRLRGSRNCSPLLDSPGP